MNDVIMMSLGLYSNVWLGLIIIGTQVVERLTRKFEVESFNQNCPDPKFHVDWYFGYWSYVSSRRKEEKKKKNTFGALLLGFLVYCLIFTY